MSRPLRNFPFGHCYHLMSRVAHQDMMLWKDECDYMLNLLYRLEVFTGIKLLSFCIMTNHFHLLIRHDAPPDENLSADEIVRRVGCLEGETFASCLREELNRLSRLPNGDSLVQAELDRYRVRMYDISAFMKTFKQRLTIVFNARTGHRGTMWDSRFKSVRIETARNPLSVVAAYVDLNPVRARMAPSPEQYRWSSFHEAECGNESARKGYAIIYGMEGAPWSDIRGQHMCVLAAKAPIIAQNERAFQNGTAFGCEDYVKAYCKESMPQKRTPPVTPAGGIKAWGNLRFARHVRG